MATKLQLYSDIAERTVDALTERRGNWIQFLETAAQMYKYPFSDQLMIFAQRPDAISCAAIDVWNNIENTKMDYDGKPWHRRVRGGSKGIALIDDTGSYPRLKYVFDIADTYSVQSGNDRPYIWEMRQEHKEPVMDALAAVYDDVGGTLSESFRNIAFQLATEYYNDNARDIRYRAEDSYLEAGPVYDFAGTVIDDADDGTLGTTFIDALTKSVAYTLMTRCGLDTSEYFDDEDFQVVTDFNTQDMVYALGTATGELSKQVLRDIEGVIKKYERLQAAERSERENDRSIDVHAARGLPDSRSQADRTPAGDDGAARQVRTDAESVPEGTQDSQLQPAAADRETVPAPAGSGTGGDGEARTGDESPDGAGQPARQGERPDGMDGGDEHVEGASGGNGAERTDIQLDRDAGVDEEAAPVSFSEHEATAPDAQPPPEGGAPPTFSALGKSSIEETLSTSSIKPDEVDSILRDGGNFDTDRLNQYPYDSRSTLRIAAYFAKNLDDNADFLKREYLFGRFGRNPAETGKGYVFGSKQIAVWYADEGIWLAVGNTVNGTRGSVLITWEQAADRVKELFDAGKFVSHDVLDEALYNESKERADDVVEVYQNISRGLGDIQYELKKAMDKEQREAVKDDWKERRYLIRGLTELDRKADEALNGENKATTDEVMRLYRETVSLSEELPQEWLFNAAHPEMDERVTELLRDKGEISESEISRGIGYSELSEYALILKRLREDIAALADEPDAPIRFYRNPHRVLRDLERAGLPAHGFPVAEIPPASFTRFITEDEIDASLLHGGSYAEGKMRFLSHFLNEHTPQERIDFVKNEYGYGGGTYIEINGWRDATPSKGFTLKRGNLSNPEAEVNINWNTVAKRTEKLINEGRFMTQAELDRIHEYERIMLARAINSFYYNLTDEYERPFAKELDFHYPHEGEWEAINSFLGDTGRIDATLSHMQHIFVNTPEEDRYYQSRKAGFEALVAFREGTYTLFPGLDKLPAPGTFRTRRLREPIINLSERGYGERDFGEPPQAVEQMSLFSLTEPLPSVVEQERKLSQALRQEPVETNAPFMEIPDADAPFMEIPDADAPFMDISDIDKARIAEQFAENPRSREAASLVREIYGDSLDMPLPQAIKRISELVANGRFASAPTQEEQQEAVTAPEAESPESITASEAEIPEPSAAPPKSIAWLENILIDGPKSFTHKERIYQYFSDGVPGITEAAAFLHDVYGQMYVIGADLGTLNIPSWESGSDGIKVGSTFHADWLEIARCVNDLIDAGVYQFSLDEFQEWKRVNAVRTAAEFVADVRHMEAGDIYTLFEQVREELSERGFAVSGEMIEDCLNEYHSQGGKGDFRDVADFIVDEYLTEEAEQEAEPEPPAPPDFDELKRTVYDRVVADELFAYHLRFSESRGALRNPLNITLDRVIEELRLEVPEGYFDDDITDELFEFVYRESWANRPIPEAATAEQPAQNESYDESEEAPASAQDEPIYKLRDTFYMDDGKPYVVQWIGFRDIGYYSPDTPYISKLMDKAEFEALLRDNPQNYEKFFQNDEFEEITDPAVIAEVEAIFGENKPQPVAAKLYEETSPSGTDTTAYYLFHNPDGVEAGAALSQETLSLITERADAYVICADVCYLSESEMAQWNMVFRKLPRDWNLLPEPVQDRIRTIIPEYERQWLESTQFERDFEQWQRDNAEQETVETATTDNLQVETPRIIYKKHLNVLLDEIRKDTLYNVLRDRETTVFEATPMINEWLDHWVHTHKEGNAALFDAYNNLENFAAWLVEDLLNRTYFDLPSDSRDSVARYEHEPGISDWARRPLLEEQIREDLYLRGFVVSEELIADGLSEYRAHGGRGDFQDIADFIEDEFLTEEPEHEITEPAIPVPQLPSLPLRNFRITDDHIGEGGAKTKFRNNITALQTLKTIELENRDATPEEQETLSRYVGWGGIPQAFDSKNSQWEREYLELKELATQEEWQSAFDSTLNAHYTTPIVIKAMYETIERAGFRTGNIIDPACGIGHFFGLLPDSMRNSKLYGVELDSLTARICKQLYPRAAIEQKGYERTEFSDAFFDVAVGNVPFGQYGVADSRYKQGFHIHDYFFQKTLDQVRPGGIIAFVTSTWTLDKPNPEVRKYIAHRAELLGAVRLPNNAFLKNAGTEVATDIIFLQRRERPLDIEPEWVHLGLTEDGLTLNRYYLDNPEMVLGTVALDKRMNDKYGRDDYVTCYPIEGADLAQQLKAALSYIHARFTIDELDDIDGVENNAIPADANVKNFSYALVASTAGTEDAETNLFSDITSERRVYFRENSLMYPVELPANTLERIKGMIGLRDCVHKLIALQLDDHDDAEIAVQQKKLNALYDGFRAEFGLVNSTANNRAFCADSSYYLLCSLEILDEDGNLQRKADMFTKRTIKQKTVITRVDTASEALAVSIGEKARVDLAFMSELTGFGEDKLLNDLRGVIFLNAGAADSQEKTYVTADEYLSGNIRKKLELAEAAAATVPSLNVNVEALRAVMPKDLDASEIDARLGATWINPEYIEQFMYELLDSSRHNRDVYKIIYHPHTDVWQVTGKGIGAYSDINAVVTYGTERANAYEIIDDTLNLRDVRVYDYHKDADGKTIRTLNKKQTTLAQQKQELIKQKFKDWIWKDPLRRQSLVALYNERFNSNRPREYDGSHIQFVGANPEIMFQEHQINAIARQIYGGNTLLAHVVGAGKTFEMVAAAMEGKRLGLCQKSLIAVPNHLTEQWASEFLRLYPNANILVARKKDFEIRNRKKFCAKIATGDYDAVIIGHTQLEKIPMSRERQERLINEQVWEIEEGIREMQESEGEHYAIKQLARTKKSLEARLVKLLESKKRDDVVTFEQLGVDRLFVDEAHNYKNLFMFTKMRNVAGLSNAEAQKSSDLFMKCRYMDELTGGKGIIFATGTPISNSMTEMYTMQRYLQYDKLEEMGLSHFDCWASVFGETVTSIELAPEGNGYRARTRFARFHNLPELLCMFKEIADVQTADMLNLPVPEANFETVIVEPSDLQKEMVQELSERAARVHNKMVDSSVDNMLKITTDGRKIGLDQRLMNPLLPDFEGSKVNACAKNVYGVWSGTKDERLTQLVFCDFSTPNKNGRFNVYDDIKAKLILGGFLKYEKYLNKKGITFQEIRDYVSSGMDEEKWKALSGKMLTKAGFGWLMDKGVPEHEIAYIHEADTETRKKELFAKVRQGKVRVLFGSTFKMGSGTNVQDRLFAIHDADCPWRPSDLEQRFGRIVRQGNNNPEVWIYRYATNGTFDAYLWQTIENKQRFISQIMTSKSPARSCEDVDESVLSFAEIKALCAGNPLIAEKMNLDIEVAKLRMLKAEYNSLHYRLEDALLTGFPKQVASTVERIDGIEKDAAMYAAEKEKCVDVQTNLTGGASASAKFPGMTLCGAKYAEKEPAAKALLEACKGIKGMGDELPVGEYMGFKMSLQCTGVTNYLESGKTLTINLLLRGAMTYQVELGTDAFGNITRINNALESLTQRLDGAREKLDDIRKQQEAAKLELENPFPNEAELAEKEARLALINADLNIDGNGDFDIVNDEDDREPDYDYEAEPDVIEDDEGDEERPQYSYVIDRVPQAASAKAKPSILDGIRNFDTGKQQSVQGRDKPAERDI